MNYIQQAFKVKHDFWRYLIGSLIVIIASFIGQLPFVGAVFLQAAENNENVVGMTPERMMQILEPNLSLFLMLISFVAGMAALVFVVRILHKQTMTSVATARPKLDWKRIWFAFILWGVLSSGLVLLDYFLTPEDYVYNFEWKRFAILAVIAIILIPIQTSLEEYLFRGYLMQGFGTLAKNRWFPLIMTSVIFGMLHFWNPEVDKLGNAIMIYYIGTGLFLGILTLMDEGLELALGFHAANNLFTALLVTADWTAFQTHSVLKDIAEPQLGFIDLILPVFIVFPILLLIFAKKYKWSNWKDKLFGAVVELPAEDYKIIGENLDA